MLRSSSRAVLTLVFAGLLPTGVSFAADSPLTPREPAKLVPEFCASCHGPNLTGNVAPNLLDTQSNHGTDEESVYRSIRDGWPLTGMMGFGHLLSEVEIRSLVTYINRQSNAFRFGRIPAPVPPSEAPRTSELHTFRVETLAEGLDTPWGIAFLPGSGNRMLVTERAGRLRVLENDQLLPDPIRGLPEIWARQDGGLLDVSVHPRYAENGWIYLAYSMPGINADTSMTAVVRGRIREGAWVDQQDIFRPGPELFWVDNSHYGARFLWDKDENLYYSLGERGRPYLAQDLANAVGKIHRVRDDGSPAPQNPFLFQPGALGSIWSYGHRHVQGLDFHPLTGQLWAAEHGPRAGGDELNRIEPGRNYGWPVISYGQPQIGEKIHGTEYPGMEQPVVHWTPTIAPSAVAFYTGDRFPKWKNHLLLTALSHQELRRIETDGDRVVHQEVLIKNEGRVRDVATGPDGLIYVAFNNPGRIARLVPVTASETTAVP